MKTNLPMTTRLTEREQNVLTWAFNLAHSIVAGDYNLPKPMNFAINGLQDALWELVEERGMDDLNSGCSPDFLKLNDEYWNIVREKLGGRDEWQARR